MAAENFDLKPAQQCTRTEQGHFGEALKEVFQGPSGVLAREQTWTPDQWSLLDIEVSHRSARDGFQPVGPYNKNVLDMAFGGDLYSLGKDTKTLEINGKPVETGSAQYKEATAKMENAAKSINFDAPTCLAGPVMGVYENLDGKNGK